MRRKRILRIQRTVPVALKFRPENSHLTDHAENVNDHMILQRGRKDHYLRNSTGQGHSQEVGQGHLLNRKVIVGNQVS